MITEHEFNEISVTENLGVITLTFNRPHKKNAMNLALVNEVIELFQQIEDDSTVRAVVICGSEGNFCAGGDISDMHSDATRHHTEDKVIWHFNRRFGDMITLVNQAPQVVITLLEGAVLGGGFGLACVSDVAITHTEAFFAMPETSLGIIPAQIAPFVVTRIGLTHARRLALLGERIKGEEAKSLGIAHYACNDADAMQAKLNAVLKRINHCAPQANASTKALMLKVGSVELNSLLDEAADAFTQSLASEEGKEGTQAFIQKRKPSWCA